MEHTIAQLARDIEQQLLTIYDDATLCRQYAWWLLEALTKQNKAQLIIAEKIKLSAAQEEQLNQWLDELIKQHKPLQYILGSVPFNDLEILVEPPILIPRPETEEWCLNLIEQLKKLPKKKLSILDLCSGSGCIALSLAKAFPAAHVYALDISEAAIALGKKNAQHNSITNVTFIQSDLFTNLPHNTRFDIIVSNPPYIARKAWEQLDESVKDWEDERALVANDDGLALIKKIISQSRTYLRATPGIPNLLIEIGYDQGPAVVELFKRDGFVQAQILKDLEGKDRVVQGRVDDVALTKDTH